MTTERPDRGARALSRDHAIDKAMLFTFQLSNKNYAAMRTALSSVAFVRALEQDGYTVSALPDAAALDRLRRIEAALDKHVPHNGVGHGPDHRNAGCQRCRFDAAALEPEGSAQELCQCQMHLEPHEVGAAGCLMANTWTTDNSARLQAELERLRRIEAAARPLLTLKRITQNEVDQVVIDLRKVARAALQPEGSAPDGG